MSSTQVGGRMFDSFFLIFIQEKCESLRMGLRQDQRGVRVGCTGRGRKDEHFARDHAQKH